MIESSMNLRKRSASGREEVPFPKRKKAVLRTGRDKKKTGTHRQAELPARERV